MWGIIILVLAAIFIFSIVPHGERKEQYSKEAAEIAKEFGKTQLSLFKFPDVDDNGNKGQVYAILPLDGKSCSYDDILNVEKYYELTYWLENTGATKKSADEKLNMVKNTLPYSLYEQAINIKWSEFRIENKARRKARRLNANFKGKMTACYSVIDDDSNSGGLYFILFGEGEPFKASTYYEDIYSQPYNEKTNEDAIRQVERILKYCDIEDKTIHATNLTYKKAFEHYND